MRKKYIAAGMTCFMLVSSLIMNVYPVSGGQITESSNIPTGETIMNNDGTADAKGQWYQHVFDTTSVAGESVTQTQEADVYGYIGNYDESKANGTVGYFDIHGDQKESAAYSGDENPKLADMILTDPNFISVSVPMDICLLMVETPSTTIDGNENLRNGFFLAPNYRITNSGSKVTVSIAGVKDMSADLTTNYGLQLSEGRPTNLADGTDTNSYYLALAKASEDTQNSFNGLTETSLYNLLVTDNNILSDDKLITLGTLDNRGSYGEFTFKGAAAAGFFDDTSNPIKVDENFPVATSDPNSYIMANARAKYKFIYKFTLTP